MIIQSLRAFRLALFSWFGGSGVLCGLVCLVGLVGLVCFFCLFFEMEKDPIGDVFSHFLKFFHGFLELRGHFFGDFGVLGSSLDAFGARGGPGSRCCRNTPLHWSPFGSILGSFLE